MDPERWKQIDALLEAATRLPSAERESFLQQACGADAGLKQEVESLLIAGGNLEGFLEQPAFQVLAQSAASLEESVAGDISPIGQLIGPYRLLELLGRGGMGEVWRAEQSQRLKRTVALKLIKPGMDTEAVVARFESERQALALMDHANIAR